MPPFVFSYRGPAGYVPNLEVAAAWMAWFDSMGDQLVDPGKPVVALDSVGNTSSESTQLGGYSVIRADNLEAAKVIAKGCPQLDRNGGVEIGELGEVPDLD
jgi:YCII-related domain